MDDGSKAKAVLQAIRSAHKTPAGYRVIDCSPRARMSTPAGSTPTQARLKYLLDYNPGTGQFTWRVDRPRVKAGSIAGKITQDGYVVIGVDGKRYGAHRLAVLYMTGKMPAGLVDHENLDGTDNRWKNLRDATDSQNQANTPLKSSNTSGFKGVSWRPQEGLWRADIRIYGRKTTLGYFKTPEEAHAAYAFAATAHHGDFARHA